MVLKSRKRYPGSIMIRDMLIDTLRYHFSYQIDKYRNDHVCPFILSLLAWFLKSHNTGKLKMYLPVVVLGVQCFFTTTHEKLYKLIKSVSY